MVSFDEVAREARVRLPSGAVELAVIDLCVPQGDLLAGSHVHNGPDGGLLPVVEMAVCDPKGHVDRVHKDAGEDDLVRWRVGRERCLKNNEKRDFLSR